MGYEVEAWSDFFVATPGATAALTGLVFVAVSINLDRIPNPAGGARYVVRCQATGPEEDEMQSDELRAIQAPLKERYRDDPEAAVVTLDAAATLGEGVTCKVRTGQALTSAGLHPASGGDGTALCSGDMLLEALAACAGVTMRAVATSIGLAVEGEVRAEGDLDFRGTLGVDRDAAVGFRSIRLAFDLDTDATDEQVDKLIELTERYCVVLQTLVATPAPAVAWARAA